MTDTLPDEKRGLYGKYFVARQDGKETGPCFVLEPGRDRFAVAALRVYANVCKATHPLLADDLLDWCNGIELCVCCDDGNHPPCTYHKGRNE